MSKWWTSCGVTARGKNVMVKIPVHHPHSDRARLEDDEVLKNVTAINIKRLAISFTDFARIVNEHKIYVDKTDIIHDLLNINTNYILLTRPRRFGKTLLLSTIQAILQGRKDLFENLYIGNLEPAYPFESSHVIRLSMGPAGINPDDYLDRMKLYLDDVAADYGITLRAKNIGDSVYNLIHSLYRSYKTIPLAKDGPLAGKIADIPKIAVLIDEYDYQLIPNLHDSKKLQATFAFLDDFYTGIKTAADEIRYLIVTGITTFKGLVQSGFNIIRDKSLDPAFAAICGFTEDEIVLNFEDNIKTSLENRKRMGVMDLGMCEADLVSEIVDWYDGYSWDGKTKVLNPCSLLDFFSEHIFRPYWSNTVDSRAINEFLKIDKDYFCMFYRHNAFHDSSEPDDLTEISPAAVLFQTGYLTIKTITRTKSSVRGGNDTTTYQLSIPNREVRQQFAQKIIIPRFLKLTGGLKPNEQIERFLDFCDSFSSRKAYSSQVSLISIFSYYSYKLHSNAESYYKTVILTALCFADGEVTAEISVSGGDIDLFLELPSDFMVIEVKYSNYPKTAAKDPERAAGKDNSSHAKEIRNLLDVGISKAFKQINDKGYAKKFLNQNQKKNVWLVAISIVGRDNVKIQFRKVRRYTKKA
jgi:hypothetical protein